MKQPAWHLLALLCALAAPVHAQDSVMVIDPDAPFADSTTPGGLPAAVVQQLIRTWNDSGTTRFNGHVTIAAGTRLQGPVALFRGTLRVGGVVEGPVTVINGNLVLLPGGRVTGPVLVVGGRLVKQEGSVLEGGEKVYWDLAPVARLNDGTLAPQKTPDLENLGRAEATFGVGKIRTTLHASTGGTYDRVEGFPLEAGPAFEWRATERDRVKLDLTGIVRTTTDHSDSRSDFGYRAKLEWRRFGEIGYGFGARAWSVIDVIPDQTLSRAESGWSSILLQDDQYDYYDAQGVGIYGFVVPARQFRIDLSYDGEEQSSVPANDPWSLFVNESRWRPNPLIDDGEYSLARGSVTLDTRDSDRQPAIGWYAKLSAEFGASDDVAPAALPPGVRNPIATDGSYNYALLTTDVRRYFRLSPDDRLSGRAYFSGWMGGDPLPVQRRLSLGGPSILPGDAFRQINCTPPGESNPSQASLCDRTLFFQVEFRHRLNLGWHYTLSEGKEGSAGRIIGIQTADLVFLSDLGTAWLSGTGPGHVPNNRLPSLDTWTADIGAGIDFGFIGAYLAKSVTDDGPVRLSIRLQRRF
ncbi:MAG TPA: hypothetical protein VFV65_05040 [Gemmatimonadales bacterium]|nr:hypothetical protein [Gemmatimonadales bacterium]